MKNRFIHFGLVLFLIAVVSAGFLAGVNAITKPIIEKNKIIVANAARKEVLPLAKEFKDSLAKKSEGLIFVPGVNSDGEIVGYVVVVDQNGYGGVINFSLGIDLDGKIKGLRVMNHLETPGLGAKITNIEWENSWIGRDKSYKFNKSVDAFAGATISPNSVYVGIQKALKAYSEVKSNG